MAKAPSFTNGPIGAAINSNKRNREDGAIRLALDSFVQQCLVIRGLNGPNNSQETRSFLSNLSVRMEEKARQLRGKIIGPAGNVVRMPVPSPNDGRIVVTTQPNARTIFPPILPQAPGMPVHANKPAVPLKHPKGKVKLPANFPANLDLLSTREAGDWCKHFGIPIHKMKAERIRRLKAWLDVNKTTGKRTKRSAAPIQPPQQPVAPQPVTHNLVQEQPRTQPFKRKSPAKLPLPQQAAPQPFKPKLPSNLDELSTREAASWCRHFKIPIPKLKEKRINAIKAYLDKNKGLQGKIAEIDV